MSVTPADCGCCDDHEVYRDYCEKCRRFAGRTTPDGAPTSATTPEASPDSALPSRVSPGGGTEQ